MNHSTPLIPKVKHTLHFSHTLLEELKLEQEELRELWATLEHVLRQQRLPRDKAEKLLCDKKRRVIKLLFSQPLLELVRYLVYRVAQHEDCYKSVYSALFINDSLSLCLLLPVLEDGLYLPTPAASTLLKHNLYNLVGAIQACSLCPEEVEWSE